MRLRFCNWMCENRVKISLVRRDDMLKESFLQYFDGVIDPRQEGKVGHLYIFFDAKNTELVEHYTCRLSNYTR